MRLTITKTQNGWLVVRGEVGSYVHSKEILEPSYSFNSLDKCIGQIRRIIKGWHDKPQS